MWESVEEWDQWHGGRRALHPFFRLPGVSILNVLVDTMHALCLGVLHHALGSVFWLVSFEDKYFPDAQTPAERLDALWGLISNQYERRGTANQLSNLDLRWFVDPRSPHRRYPVLTTRVKAAESRCLVPIVSDIWRRIKEAGNVHDEKVQDVLAGLTQFYECIEEDTWSAAVRDLARASLTGAMEAYQDLSVMAVDAGRRLWNEVPKHHWVQHLILQLAFGNPRDWWCYIDEDFMGIIKRIVLKSAVATAAPSVVKKGVVRWERGMAYRLQLEEHRAHA